MWIFAEQLFYLWDPIWLESCCLNVTLEKQTQNQNNTGYMI